MHSGRPAPELIVRRGEFPTYKRELDEGINDELVPTIKAKGKRMIAAPIGPAVMMYHEELWIPSAALLPERKH